VGKTRNHKLAVLAIGAFGLAGALTVAALVAPDRVAGAAVRYTPEDPAQVITRVPARDAAELAARRTLSAQDPATAVTLARLELQRYHRFSDPRYLGRAQAILSPWWKLVDPPAEVLLLRATIRQSVHEFTAAREDLDKLVALRPDDVNAQLTRAVVATITADYVAARESCATLTARPLVAATCAAPIDGIAGNAAAAYDKLAMLLPRSRPDAAVKGWTLTALAELSIMMGNTAKAEGHLRNALAVDEDDHYARGLLFDVLHETHRNAEASQLLAGREHIDSHLVRLAISEHALRSTDAARLAGLMRERIEAAAQRGDRIHLREEARFALAVERDPARAVLIAKDNWDVQKELADARLLVEAAAAVRDAAAAAPVVEWVERTGVRDAWLDRHLRSLEIR
jgi:tetratricopeptide (TPR) repeat protein